MIQQSKDNYKRNIGELLIRNKNLRIKKNKK